MVTRKTYKPCSITAAIFLIIFLISQGKYKTKKIISLMTRINSIFSETEVLFLQNHMNFSKSFEMIYTILWNIKYYHLSKISYHYYIITRYQDQFLLKALKRKGSGLKYLNPRFLTVKKLSLNFTLNNMTNPMLP